MIFQNTRQRLESMRQLPREILRGAGNRIRDRIASLHGTAVVEVSPHGVTVRGPERETRTISAQDLIDEIDNRLK